MITRTGHRRQSISIVTPQYELFGYRSIL